MSYLSLTDPTTLTLWGIFVGSFIICLSGAVMPGPVLAITITHAVRLGVRAGPLVVLGHAILEAALLVALAAGLGSLLTRPGVSGIISGAGAVIMWVLGASMLRSLPGLHLDLEARAEKASSPVRDGFLMTLANPYWSLWWATIGLSMMALATSRGLGWWGIGLFFAGHIAADLAWYLLVAFVVARGRRFISDRIHRGVVGVCAVFLLIFGAYFMIFAWRQLSSG